MNEVELASVYHEVFTRLQLTQYRLCINSRKILTALAQVCDAEEKTIDITTAIDKLDKIGIEKVCLELTEKGLNESQVKRISMYLTMDNGSSERTNEFTLQFLSEFFGDNAIGKAGIEELTYLVQHLPGNNNIYIDPTLARGLNYYTGVIFEAKAPKEVSIGSIGGGGRYDDLTGLFGVPNIPGVGISFGVDRIYDVLTELNLFPAALQTGTQVLFMNMGKTESEFAFGIMQQLRSNGISCELFHESVKINKQFNYAEKKSIPFVVIIGSKEIEQSYCLVKNLGTGLQELVVFENLVSFFGGQAT
jgi:histidyl-tRNA synthetase